jgi:hypothetical protein
MQMQRNGFFRSNLGIESMVCRNSCKGSQWHYDDIWAYNALPCLHIQYLKAGTASTLVVRDDDGHNSEDSDYDTSLEMTQDGDATGTTITPYGCSHTQSWVNSFLQIWVGCPYVSFLFSSAASWIYKKSKTLDETTMSFPCGNGKNAVWFLLYPRPTCMLISQN